VSDPLGVDVLLSETMERYWQRVEELKLAAPRFQRLTELNQAVAKDMTACRHEMLEALADWKKVLERDEQGRGVIVEYEIDAKIKTVRYRLRQVYDEPHRLSSEYLGGDFRDFSGEWRFEPGADGRTRVELDLRIDPGRFVPGPIRRALTEGVMRVSVRELKKRVEEKDGVPAS